MSGRGIQPAAKRLLDVAASLLLLALCLPLLLAAAALVKLTSPGPVLFLQERPGLGGRVFRIYKLRTMRTGSERMVKGQEVGRDDPRVTPAGRLLRRTKVDELPQLLNVLKGDMSLVGPRPEIPYYVEKFKEDVPLYRTTTQRPPAGWTCCRA